MRPSCIVKNDVLGNSFSERCFRPVFPPIKLLTLHGGEKGFNNGIIVRLAGTGERLNHGVFAQLGYERFGSVTSASIVYTKHRKQSVVVMITDCFLAF